jgi:hypothetical protein
MRIPLQEQLLWSALGGGLRALAEAMNFAARRDPLLARALEASELGYRFESAGGRYAHHLVVRAGRVRACATLEAPSATLTFRSAGALLAVRPSTLVGALIAGQIVQSGSTYPLYRLGFLLGLTERALSPRGRR